LNQWQRYEQRTSATSNTATATNPATCTDAGAAACGAA
jgi:hypothetical protein